MCDRSGGTCKRQKASIENGYNKCHSFHSIKFVVYLALNIEMLTGLCDVVYMYFECLL